MASRPCGFESRFEHIVIIRDALDSASDFFISMIRFPTAKINIGLDIVNRRQDGYHDIVSVFYPLPWRDILEIVPAKGAETTLTVTGRPCDCPTESNLVMKAYLALDAVAGPLPASDIFLHKVIPDGAGLGGGSADAAFTLAMLNDIHTLGLSRENLAEIAGQIGADCAFFVWNRPMIATGTGTDLQPIDLSLEGMWITVVKPQAHVSTREAYAHVTPRLPELHLPDEIISRKPAEWSGRVKNDFEESVFAQRPEIAAVKSRLAESGAVYASMSGSGSAVYALFESDTLAEKAAAMFPGCDTFTARI